MTKAQVERKLQSLRDEHDRAVANVHALSGAIQVLDQLLKAWDQPEVVKPEGDLRLVES